MEEIWKDIDGYVGRYQVSTLGNVKRLKRLNKTYKTHKYHNKFANERPLSILKNKRGYCWVALCNGESKKNHFIHRLVATAFIPNPCNYPIVNHKDENPSNNSVENLEWCTYKYNANYGSAKGRHRPDKIKDDRIKNRFKPVKQMDKNGNLIKIHKGVTIAAKELGMDYRAITNCCRGKYSQTGGFKWEYLNNDGKYDRKKPA